MKCKHCGHKLGAVICGDFVYCPYCGERIKGHSLRLNKNENIKSRLWNR